MFRKLSIFLVLPILVGGCIKQRAAYTLNPDGSGKIFCDVIFSPLKLQLQSQESDAAASVQREVKKILYESEGIDAWADVSYKLNDAGDIQFVGTAYFPDIEQVKIKAGGFNENSMLSFSKGATGAVSLELKPRSKDDDAADPNDKPMTQEQVEKEVKAARLDYKGGRAMLVAMFGELDIDRVFHLPGEVATHSNFEKVSENSVRLHLQGTDIIGTLDKMMADEEWLTEQIRAGKRPMQDGPDDKKFNELMFGQAAGIKAVTVKDVQQQFDYEAEVKQVLARAESSKDKLFDGDQTTGSAPAVKAEAIEIDAGSEGLIDFDVSTGNRRDTDATDASESVIAPKGSIRVGGVKLIRESDSQRGIKPFYSAKGYTLSLILEMPEPNLPLINGELKKAVTDTGQNLLLQRNTNIPFPKLSEDETAAVFEVKLELPEDDARAIAELSGILSYLEHDGVEQLDLGTMDFEEGAISSPTGFSIRSIVTPEWDKNRMVMQLRVDMLRGALESVRMYDVNGEEIEVRTGGSSYSQGKMLSVTLTTKDTFPPRGRIVMDVLSNARKKQLRFELKNISLTGVPMQ